MKKIDLGKTGLMASEISLGCMRICGLDYKTAENLVLTAFEEDVNLFDHADIYGEGKSEEIFGDILKNNPSLRNNILVQTKCAIHDGIYDFSKEHILKSVDASLKRLNCDYIDILLLHRPDTLMEPEEVAETFELLNKNGKVKYFGVSNQNSMQIKLLSKYLKQKLIINQLQLSLTNTTMIDAGFNVNMENNPAIVRDGSILEFCRLEDITIQAWSPFQYGFFEGVFLNNDKFPHLNKKIDEIAKAKNVSNSAIAVAWILRHPAKIQTIIGTTNVNRLKEICKASDVSLSKQEWYELYKSAGNILP